jgi:hypothetical protein
MPTLPTPLIACSSNGTYWTCSWQNQNQMPNASSAWYINDVNVGDQFGPGLEVAKGPWTAYLAVSQAGHNPARSATAHSP